MVFDKFKSWRSSKNLGVPCPSCQHRNPEGTKVCTRCYYQIDRPAFEQDSGLEENESNDLLDQLMSEIEKEEGEQEEIPTAFSMDDVTIEVAQYGDDDQIFLSEAPDFQTNTSSSEPEEEDYELTAADIPAFVQKFEVPKETDDEESTEITEKHVVELIQPTADTPDFVDVVSASEVPDTNGWPKPTGGLPVSDPADFDGDGRVDAFEAAFANSDSDTEDPFEEKPKSREETTLPPAPSDLPIPTINSTPVPKVPEESHEPTPIPPAPAGLADPVPLPLPIEVEETQTFWPWHQQEEWPTTDIIKQLQSAIRAAKEQNMAEATVLLDGVGPHLGNRSSLVYSVGRLLMSIGRGSEAIRMVETASRIYPEDPDIAKAREKLSS